MVSYCNTPLKLHISWHPLNYTAAFSGYLRSRKHEIIRKLSAFGVHSVYMDAIEQFVKRFVVSPHPAHMEQTHNMRHLFALKIFTPHKAQRNIYCWFDPNFFSNVRESFTHFGVGIQCTSCGFLEMK